MKPSSQKALRSKPGREAVEIIDQQVCDLKKKLNSLRVSLIIISFFKFISSYKAETERRQKRVDEYRTKERLLTKAISDQEATAKGESAKAQYLRSIENRLDKAILKQQEAEHVKVLYEKMLNQLRNKALTFDNTLEEHETSIDEANHELKRVKEMLVDAQAARDKAKEQLNENEEALIKQRRQRERELQELRQRAEEKRGAEAIERRVTRQSLSRTGSTPAPLNEAEHQKQQQTSSADLEARLAYYEQIYQKIKDATGVSSIVEG